MAATALTTGDAVAMADDISVLNSAFAQTIGKLAENNVVTTMKMLDNDYIEGHRVVSLTQALGVREVAAKNNPGGPSPTK